MPNSTRQQKIEALGRVIGTLDMLRTRCPWDAKQTNQSLKSNTIEETYELVQALTEENPEEIRKELGDVLLHILFYAKIGDEKNQFDIADVADALNQKLIFRHPHVFGQTVINGTGDEAVNTVLQNWEELKLKEKGGNKTALAGVPVALPSLIKAFRIQEKASHLGFDWEDREQVWDKLFEEIGEVRQAIKEGHQKEHIEEEFGDLLFAVVNASRLYGITPENALERTNRKFIRRFNHIEARAKEMGKSLRDMTLAEMDQLWDEAKALEREADAQEKLQQMQERLFAQERKANAEALLQKKKDQETE